MAERMIRARGVVRGTAEGKALVSPAPISFLGDVDMETGEIVAAGHPLRGRSVAGRVLVYPEAKGSSGGPASASAFVSRCSTMAPATSTPTSSWAVA